MKIFNLTDDEPVTVKGKPGKDKITAVVPEGSFVVPVENAPVAVKLTKEEVVIPPSKVPVVDAKAKAAGMNGIQDLAPERYTVNNRDLTWEEYRNGFTESQLRDKKGIQQTVVPQAKNAKYLNQTAPVRFNNDGSITNLDNMQELATGGFVDPQLDENGNPVEDMPVLEPKPIQPVVPQAQADQIVQQHATDAMYGNAENEALKGLVDSQQGVQEARNNSQKIYDMLGLATPKMDEKKAERLKRIAGINAVGQALSTAFGGYVGTKGGPILDTRSNITPAALAEYNAMIKEDKDNQTRTKLAQVNEAIRGMHEVAQIELANKRYNQKVMADARNMINKAKLDDFLEGKKNAYKLLEMATKYGYDEDIENIKSEKQLERLKLQLGNAIKVANIHESGANSRSKGTHSTNAPVTFSIGGVDDEISENDVVALANIGIAAKEHGLDDRGQPVTSDDLAVDPEYQYMIRASQGGLNAKELKQFVQRYYPIYKDRAGVKSKNDMGKPAAPISYLTPNGQVQQIQVPGYGTPSQAAAQPQPAEDPFKRFGGRKIK